MLPDSPATGLKYQKRKKPIRKTPTIEEFRAVVDDIRAQVYNADSKDSADFVEFIGLAGLGQAEASSLTWGEVIRSPPFAGRRSGDLPCRFIRNSARCSNACENSRGVIRRVMPRC